jgi:hypothetical protein
MKRSVLFLALLAAAVPAVAADPVEQLAEALTSQSEGKVSPPKVAVLTFKCDEGVARKDGRAAARSLAEHLKNIGRLDVLVGNSEEQKALESAFQNENGPNLQEIERLGTLLGVGGVVTGELEPEPDGGVVIHARIIRSVPYGAVAAASWRIPRQSKSRPAARRVNPALDQGDEYLASKTGVSFNASIASRTDNFRWNIAGDSNGRNPNILSELSWEAIRIEELRLAAEAEAFRMSFQGYFAVGRIISGRNQDSDYFGDNRTMEVSRSNNVADMGRTQDYRFSLGFPVGDLKQGRMTPRLGWGQALERLSTTNGNQTIATAGLTPPLGPFPGLNGRYEHRWRGILLGVDAGTKIVPRLEVAGSFRFYPQLNYLADADWNLRPDIAHPKSFEHTANGKGWDLDLSAFYDLGEGMDFGVEMDWRHWRASNGTDRTFYPDGSSFDTRLNEVVWNSYAFQLAFRFRPTDLGPEQN